MSNLSNLSDLPICQWIKAGKRFEGRGDGHGLILRYRAVDAVPMWRFLEGLGYVS
ncbi:MAG: hypothetical protein IPM89_10175 [Candidatus Competibacteraceae bacterium]|nr:MAG: hypothetical protein IPM89_10175 [Candidatus Competibacteraceae bacterium]